MVISYTLPTLPSPCTRSMLENTCGINRGTRSCEFLAILHARSSGRYNNCLSSTEGMFNSHKTLYEVNSGRYLYARDDLRLEELQLRIAFCSMVVTWLRSSFSPLVQSEHVSVPPRYLRMTGADVDILEAYAERRYCNQKSLQIFSWNPAASSPYPDKRIPGRRMKCKWRQV